MNAKLIFVVFVLCAFCTQCKRKNNINPTPKPDVSFDTDTIPLLNKLYKAYQIAAKADDTTQLKITFNQYYNAIDSISFLSDNYFNTLANYCAKGIYTAEQKTNQISISHVSAFLQYQIFLYFTIRENEKLIACFNRLNEPAIRKTISDNNYLQRLIEVGATYNQIGDDLQAEQTYRQTIQLATTLKQQDEVAKANINLNKLRLKYKQYDSIINTSERLINQPIKPQLKASLCSDISLAYFNDKNFKKAKEYNELIFNYLQALDSSDRPGDYDRRLGAAYAIKATVNEDKVADRDESFKKALQLYERYYNGKGRDLAKLYIKIGDHVASTKNSSFKETPINFYNKALQALSINCKPDDPFAMPTVKDIRAENTLFEICDAKADYLRKQNSSNEQAEKILALYDVSFEVERKLMNYFIYDNSKIDFVNQSRNRSAKALEICYQLAAATKSSVWQNKALSYFENSKSIALIDKLKQSLLLSNNQQQDSLVKIYNKLQKERVVWYEKENGSSKDSGIAAINQKILAITDAIEKTNPQFKQLTNQGNISSIDDVRKKLLNSKTIAVNYFLQNRTLYSIIVSQKDVQFIKKNDFDTALLNKYKTQLADIQLQYNAPMSFLNNSAAMFNALFPMLPGKNAELLISPDADLFGVSFDALLTSKPTGTNYSNQPYLVKNNIIRYAFSLSSLLFTAGTSFENNKILAVAPVTEISNYGKDVLPNSALELQEINKAGLPTVQLKHKEANFKNFNHQLRNHNLIHIASHAQFNLSNGTASIDFFDTSLTTNYFYGDGLQHVRLFFMSACETGIGKQVGSEGVLSLARSVYYAGAQNVISSHWKINDDASAQIVSDFYKLSRKTSFSAALRGAKLNYLLANNNEKAAPFYWAAFNLIGRDDTSNMNFYNRYKAYIIAAAILLIGAVATIVYRRSKNTK